MHGPIERTMAGFFRFLTRHSVLVLVLVAVATGAMVDGVRRLQTDFRPNSIFDEESAGMRLRDRMLELFGDTDDQVFIAIRTDDVFDKDFLKLLDDMSSDFEEQDHVVKVTSLTNVEYFLSDENDGFNVGPLIDQPYPYATNDQEFAALRERFIGNDFFRGLLVNEESTVTAVVVEFVDGMEEDQQRFAQRTMIESITDTYLTNTSKVKEFHLTGIPIVQAEYLKIAIRDQFFFIALVGTLFFIILAVLFGNVLGILSPALVVGLSILGTISIMGWLGEPLNMVSTASPTIIAVYGIADAIHILLRYREELGKGKPKNDAIVTTMVHLGKACFLTSFTTFIGFMSLLTAENALVESFGVVTGGGVMLAYIFSMIVMAPLMHLFPVMQSHSRKWESEHLDTIGRWLTSVRNMVPNNKLAIIGVTVVLIGLSGWGASTVRKETHLLEELSDRNPVTLGSKFYQKHLSGILDFEIVLEVDEPNGILEPEVLQTLKEIELWLEAQPSVSSATSIATFMESMNEAFHGGDRAYRVVPDSRQLAAQYKLLYEISEPDSEILRPVINADGTIARVYGMRYDFGANAYLELREEFEEYARANVGPDLHFQVYGVSSMVTQSILGIVTDLLNSLGSAMIIISIVLAISFRSWQLGLLAMVPNALPLITAMGVMGIADITLRTATVIIFSISLGIAVDDTVHFLARYTEELRRTGSAEEAVGETILTVGRAMLFTSALLIGGFSVLLTSDFRALFHFGMLTSVAVLTAILADLLFTPALVLLIKPGERAAQRDLQARK